MWSPFRFTRLLALLVLPSLPAAAETAVIPWGGLEIPYDTAEWRWVSEPDARGRFMLACIAPECSEGQNLFGAIGPATDLVEQPPWRGPMELSLDNPALPFRAYRTWTGCRARDSAILTAAVLHEDRVYSLLGSLREGCNFAPEMPEAPFIKLVSSIRPRHWNAIHIAGIRIRYDTGRWRTMADGDEAGHGALATCILRQCDDWNHGQAHVRIRAIKDVGTQCDPAGDLDDGFGTDRGSEDFGGLSMHLWRTFSGCRARTPPQENACGIHNGVVYRFVSGAHSGCSAGIEGVPEALFRELFSGIAIVDDTAP